MTGKRGWGHATARKGEKNMSAVIITKDNFEEEVLKSDIPVIVDFWAVWCGPCQLQAPELAKFEKEHEGQIKTAKVNVDEQGDLAAQYGVQAIPTLILFKNGEEVKRTVGLQNLDQLNAEFI